MLARKYKLKKDNDFKGVFEKGKYYQGGFIRLKYLKNEIDFSRLAVIISAKTIKKATERNLAKRRVEEAIRLNWRKIKRGFDIILIIQPGIREKTYLEIETELIALFKKAKLID